MWKLGERVHGTRPGILKGAFSLLSLCALGVAYCVCVRRSVARARSEILTHQSRKIKELSQLRKNFFLEIVEKKWLL
jgi:hypothetical protein